MSSPVNTPTDQPSLPRQLSNKYSSTSVGIDLLLDAAKSNSTAPRPSKTKHLTIESFSPKDTVMVCPNPGCTYAKLVPPTSPSFGLLPTLCLPDTPKTILIDKVVAPEAFTKTSQYRNMKRHVITQCKFLCPHYQVPKFFTHSNKPGPAKGYNKGIIKTLDRCHPNSVVIACSGCGLAKELPIKCLGKISTKEISGRHLVDEEEDCIPEARSPAIKHMRSHILKCNQRKSNRLPRFYWKTKQHKEADLHLQDT